MSIMGNMVGGTSPLKTLVIVDENGNEFTGVVTDSEVIFTATDSDVRAGAIYAGDNGVSIGSKDILEYRTTQGYTVIPSGKSFSIKLSQYDSYNYTKLQCIIAPFNTNLQNSCAFDKIVVNDKVYAAMSADVISTVSKNTINKSIDLNIMNDSDKIYLIYFFTYKEEE